MSHVYCNQGKGSTFNHGMRTILIYCHFVNYEQIIIIIINESAFNQKPSMMTLIRNWHRFGESMCDRKQDLIMGTALASSSASPTT